MKIIPLTIQYNYKKAAFGAMQTSGSINFLQDGITSQTAQLLYNLDYKPVGKPRTGYFLTYVLDRQTLKPVDIYVKRLYSYFRCPKESRFNEEKYLFYRENPDGSLKLVGERWMTFDILGKTIAPGSMDSMDKTLLGIGIREQQASVERMLDIGFDNVIITSVPEAYEFHKKSGFQSSNLYQYMNGEETNDFIENWSERLKIRKSKIVEMLVYDNVCIGNNDSSSIKFNVNKTLEKFLLYLKNKGQEAGAEICIKMELGPNALIDWIGVANKKSIFHGKFKELK